MTDIQATQDSDLPQGPDAHALAVLVHLGRRVRHAQDQNELNFILANETHALLPYRQSVLWLRGKGISTLSGVVAPEANAPYVQWLKGLFQAMPNLDATLETDQQPQLLRPEMFPEAIRAEWQQWLPDEVLALTLGRFNDFPGGLLLLGRDHPWQESEIPLLLEWTETWTHAMAERSRRPGLSLFPSSKAQPSALWRTGLKYGLIAFCIGAFFIPVHLSVLAPAELVPLNPSVIRAPMDGVVDKILVQPNQHVTTGEGLFEFDRTVLANKLEVAQGALTTTQAEYRQRSQRALFEAESKSQLAVLQGQIAEKEAEVTFLKALNERALVHSPIDGLALFGDPTEWVGRPVVTGEKVMMVADEYATEVEAWLSPTDAISLPSGARVRLYLNADPLRPLQASLRYLAHEAIQRPDGNYAYRVRATLEPLSEENRDQARVGLKGTAKLEGEKVSLAYWVLRRPLAGARAWLGL
jgi:hypothetical protein